jgi:hypothetical protein
MYRVRKAHAKRPAPEPVGHQLVGPGPLYVAGSVYRIGRQFGVDAPSNVDGKAAPVNGSWPRIRCLALKAKANFPNEGRACVETPARHS